MKKVLTLAAVAVLTTVSASYAADQSDIDADKGAIAKDNTAIAKQNGNVAVNRSEKANAKANGDYGSQASESVQIGANKTARTLKKGEKQVDQKILNHDANSAQ